MWKAATASLTMSQCGARLGRARSAGLDTEDDPDHVVGDLDPLDQGADDLAPQVPVRGLQPVAHHLGEHAQLPDHQLKGAGLLRRAPKRLRLGLEPGGPLP
jgi:hypothetical protein